MVSVEEIKNAQKPLLRFQLSRLPLKHRGFFSIQNCRKPENSFKKKFRIASSVHGICHQLFCPNALELANHKKKLMKLEIC